MGAKATFDSITRIITLTEAPTLVNGEMVVEFDIKIDLYSDGKEDWKASEALRKLRFPVRATGGDDLPGSKALGSTFFLANDWKVKPYEADHVLLVNGNFYSEDGTSPFIQTTGTWNVFLQQAVSSLVDSTVQQLPEIEYASFNGGVYFDVTSPYSGTVYPTGTPQEPVNNAYDGYDIAIERGFVVGYLLSDLMFPTDLPIAGFTFIGAGKDRTLVTVPDAASVSECTYENAEVTGYLDGNNTLRGCTITNLNYIKGFIEECALSAGTIVLAGTEVAHFIDCYSGAVGASTPTIDCGGSGQELALRNYNGGIKLTNKNGTESISIDLNSGQVILDNTVTAGTIVVRGVGKLIDTSGNHIHSGAWNGATIVSEVNNPEEVAEHVWDSVINGQVPGSFGAAAREQAFNGKIWVDVANGSAGTAYPLGTSATPVNNITDGITIGGVEGIYVLKIAEDATVAGTDNLDGFMIEGAHATKSEITVLSGASTNFTQFSQCYLIGALNGWVVVRESTVEDLTGVEGIFHETMINGGSITLAGTKVSHFLSCYSGVPGTATPEIDFGGSGRTCAFRNYNGGIKLTNKTGTESFSMDLNSGQVIVDDTVTSGDIVIRGTGKWTNELTYAGGANIIEELVEGHRLHDLHRASFNHRVWDKVGDTVTIYGDDGVTPLHVFDVNSDMSVITPR